MRLLTIRRTKALWIIFVNLQKKNIKINTFELYDLNDCFTLTRHAVNMDHGQRSDTVGRFGHASFVFPDFSSRNDSPTADAMPGARNKLAGVLFRQNMHHKRLEALQYAVRSYFRGEVAYDRCPRWRDDVSDISTRPRQPPDGDVECALLSRRRSPPLETS